MLILVLLLTANSPTSAQQELCYLPPGDSYSGYLNTTDRGLPCDNWDTQSLIKLDSQLNHNYCRVVLELSQDRPFCVVKGQKHPCVVPTCDPATLLFEGYGMIMTRNMTRNKVSLRPVVMQAINFYIKVDEIKASKATLVQVQSKSDPLQLFSVVLKNGYLKLVINLDSYNTESVFIGGPVTVGDVHYISVNRSYETVYLRLNDTLTNYTLVNKDTTFLVAPYQVIVGDNYFGCMAGLSVGSWLQDDRKSQVKMYVDKPLTYYTGYDIEEFTIQRMNNGTPKKDQCMFAPPTTIRNSNYPGVSEYDLGSSVEESEVGTDVISKRGTLDTTSIIIISSALGVIFFLTALVIICMKRNQNLYTPQGYNLEVM